MKGAVTAKQGWYIRYIEDFTGEIFSGVSKFDAVVFINSFLKFARTREDKIKRELAEYIQETLGIQTHTKSSLEIVIDFGDQALKEAVDKENPKYKLLEKIYGRYTKDDYTKILFTGEEIDDRT